MPVAFGNPAFVAVAEVDHVVAPRKCHESHRSPTWDAIDAILGPTKPGGEPFIWRNENKIHPRGIGTGHRAVSGASESAWSTWSRRSQAALRSPEVCGELCGVRCQNGSETLGVYRLQNIGEIY